MAHAQLQGDEWESPCVHCGLCLDTCPTYRLTGLEAESPRGRLYLMNAVLEGSVAFDPDVIRHLDSCLGCLACESACPSGVRYGRRIEEFRPQIERSTPHLFRRARARLARAGANVTALRLARGVASVFDRLRGEGLRRRIPGLDLIPRSMIAPTPRFVPPPANPRLRVALLVGCVTNELRPSITASTVNVLHRNDIGVVVLPRESCCGALSLHSGDSRSATQSAAALCDAVARSEADYVVTTAAGCGAVLLRYEELFARGAVGSDLACWVARNARDVCELLVEAGLRAPRPIPTIDRTVAYHDACHLLHGCGIDRAPREVLSAAGIRWFDLGENSICCGSAGVYNLIHRHVALDLARRKVDLAVSAGASEIAVGNVGCIMQLERSLALAGHGNVSVWHPIELLEEAYCGEIAG
jgi:glycolate oxidase iron-sulfur subunit